MSKECYIGNPYYPTVDHIKLDADFNLVNVCFHDNRWCRDKKHVIEDTKKRLHKITIIDDSMCSSKEEHIQNQKRRLQITPQIELEILTRVEDYEDYYEDWEMTGEHDKEILPDSDDDVYILGYRD